MNEYSGFKTGLASRLGPLSIGVTDFRALFSVGKVRGTEFYLGLRLPILYSAIKDKDKEIKMYALKLREFMAALPH